MPHKILWLALAVLPATGCAKETPPPAITEVQVSSAEYDTAPRLTLTPARIMCGAEAGTCDFSSVVAAAADLQGGLLLWEAGKPVRRYDSTGRHWADIGRKGKGPGEYEFAVAASVTPAGIQVVDVSNLRIARFDSAGSFIDFTSTRNVPQTTRELSLVDGRLVAISIQPLSDGSGSVFRALRFEDGSFSDTLIRYQMVGYASGDGPMWQMPGLFEAYPVWGVIGQSLAFSTGKEFEVWEYRDRVPVRRLTVDHPPRKVEPSELERSSARRLARAGPMRASVEDAIRRAAKVQPAITQMFGTTDGGMLLREATDVAGDSVRWSRFTLEWTLSGYFMLAEDTRVLLVEPGRVLVSEELTDGVQVRWMLLP